MGKRMKLAVGFLFFLSVIAVGQNTPQNISPNGSLEPTKLFFQISHENGNQFYDIQVDTTTNFNSVLKREIVGGTDYLAVQNSIILTDSIKDLHYGKTYYWRSRSRSGADTSNWSSPLSFTTLYAPEIDNPINETAVSPSNFYVWTNHKRGNTEYIIETSQDIGFTYPIYYRAVSTVFMLNPDLDHNVAFGTKLNGMPASGEMYVRLKMYNDVDSSEWSPIVKVYLNEFLSVDNISIKAGNVFPNPSTGIISLKSEVAADKITVMDVNGKVVSRHDSVQNNQIDVHFLPDGIYLLRIQVGEGVIYRKVRILK